MTQTHSKSRQQAEIAFTKVQSQSLARSQAVEDVNCVDAARNEKTLRLRTARLAKEQQDRMAIGNAPVSAQARKP